MYAIMKIIHPQELVSRFTTAKVEKH